MRKLWTAVASVLGFAIVFAGGTGTGIVIQAHNSTALSVSKDSVAEFRLIEDAWGLTRAKYVDKSATEPRKLAYGSIAGMIDSLGDTGHSTFLTPDEVKQMNQEEQGTLQGIGIEVQEKNGEVVIVAPIDGSPAQKAGLRSGDVIVAVNGETISTVSDAVKLILGPAGTKVTLTVQDATAASRDVTIVRAVITLISVTWRQLPGSSIAHLRIATFDKGATSQLDAALAQIKAQGAAGIILDLRDNPGGLLDEATGVASRFLTSGNVLIERDADGKTTPVPVEHGGSATDLPMVVLINEGTASAAEIVSGALQDADRAKLVGETTFGTGTVLNEFSLSDGSALLLAIQEWLTPSGKTIWHKGLTPDQVVPLPSGVAPLFPESEKDLTAAQLQSSGDQQLLTAMGLVGR
jgi:carboxyl-terminal processing protease